jgi:glutaredoxin
MNRLAEEILRFLDASKQGPVDAATLAAQVSARAAGDEPASEIRWLVAQGLLKERAGRLSLTEDARLAMRGPRELTLYTRPGCHLCDEAKTKIVPLLQAHRASLREVNIDEDPILRTRYNEEVPVLFLGARKVAKFHVDVEQLARLLTEARK